MLDRIKKGSIGGVPRPPLPDPLWAGDEAYPRADPAEKKAQGSPAGQANIPTVSWSGDTQLAATTPTP
jgi:hypothetical protein